jgi:virginiamycin B lyase
VILDKDGSAWFTDGGQNAIVRVDAKTLAVKAWPLPKDWRLYQPQHGDLRQGGHHWFTGQNGITGASIRKAAS